MRVNFSTSMDFGKDYESDSCNFENFDSILLSNICYSPILFKEGRRLAENYTPNKTNMIVLDFDEGTTIEEARQKFDGVEYMIGTTRNHLKVKGGSLEERFRVCLPTYTLAMGRISYSKLMKYLALIWGADMACSDAARMFFGNSEGETFYSDGEPYDWRPIFVTALEFFDQNTGIPGKRNSYQGSDHGLKAVEWTEDSLRRIFKVNEISEAKHNRNNELARITLWLRDEGFSGQETENLIMRINSMLDSPLPKIEIINKVIGKKFQ